MDQADRVKKGRPASQPPKPTPKRRSLMKILSEVKARLYGQSEAKRGGSGSDANLTPDPRTTHWPEPKIQGVCC
jgi:hypothetical protein